MNNNDWITGRDNIENSFLDYVTHLFQTFAPSIPFDLVNLISLVIEQEESLLLEIVPSAEEIFDIVKSMGTTKAPGPDGLPPLFFKE